MIVNTLFILNDAPYGTERSCNGLRLAPALGKLESETVRVFLLGDAVACAKAGQTYYNAGDMVRMVGGEVALCGTCMDARGLGDGEVVKNARRSTLKELAEWTAAPTRRQTRPSIEGGNERARKRHAGRGLLGLVF